MFAQSLPQPHVYCPLWRGYASAFGSYGVGAVTLPPFDEELPPIGTRQSETFQRPS
jgi:hypothetical protein